jgi:hypothetical protein
MDAAAFQRWFLAGMILLGAYLAASAAVALSS